MTEEESVWRLRGCSSRIFSASERARRHAPAMWEPPKGMHTEGKMSLRAGDRIEQLMAVAGIARTVVPTLPTL